MKKYIIIILFILLFVNGLGICVFYKDKKEKEDILYKNSIKNLRSNFNSVKRQYKKLINYAFYKDINNKYILRLIKKKNKKKLTYELKRIFNYLRRENVDKIFILDLTGKLIAGVSKDKLSNQFKPEKLASIQYVYPLTYKNSFLGNIYFSIPFSVIQEELNKIFPETYLFLLNKDIIVDKIKRKTTKIAIPSEISANFYYENMTLKNIPISLINSKIKEEVQPFLSLKKPISLVYKYKNNYILISFYPVYNLKQQFIGYLVSYSVDNTYGVIIKSYYLNIILTFLISIVLAILVYITIKNIERFRYLAETDRLTDLYNKGKFNEVLSQEIERARRYKRPLSLIVFDIDHFKKINDTYGHKVGDEVLKALAKLVRKKVRKTDFVARWGGEEFVILAPETDLEGAKKLAEKIRQAVENYEFPTVKKVTISLGVAQLKEDDTPDDFIVRADKALYKAKEGGRNQVQVTD
ncbi:GGDEF domain-containing protein [Hydrogenothermus marinus]|uniref:diguanylate cyclase n=1 Tax=Hydrogenothermus marinus TaxID=133270 RepID=A0A3M0BT69_9AQUI|nr:GGDEF domain-containing protein [Hydrogenothermus marinus]RMA97715.1 diguanylate cyclase (GGDEF)-like protein [Hydrogenothermus marinus]